MLGERLCSFVDGGYLREIATAAGQAFYNPRELSQAIVNKQWGMDYRPTLWRTTYFDAEPSETVDPALDQYWDDVEILPETHLGFCWLRGKRSKKREARQKAVDTLIAVEMVSGAYNKRFDIALLIAGDADYVPVVDEVRRAGPHILVAAATDIAKFACSDELRRAADWFVKLPATPGDGHFKDYFKSLVHKP